MKKPRPANTPLKSGRTIEGPWLRLSLDRYSITTPHDFPPELHAKIAVSLFTGDTRRPATAALHLLDRCAEQLRRHPHLLEVHATFSARLMLERHDQKAATKHSLVLLAHCAQRLKLNVRDRAKRVELLREVEKSGLPSVVEFKKAMRVITRQEKHSQRAERDFLSFLETHFGNFGTAEVNRQLRLHERWGFSREDVVWLRNRYDEDRDARRLKSSTSDKPMRKRPKKVLGGKVSPKS